MAGLDLWALGPDPHCFCLPSQFRLKRCGLGHRVYLVEEHGSIHNLSLPESTLLQAVTNTQVSWEGGTRLADFTAHGTGQERPSLCHLLQVIDGFFVKRTMDIKESAGYLALLTKGLERLYQVSRRLYLTLAWCLLPKQGKVGSQFFGLPTEAWERASWGVVSRAYPGLSPLFHQGHTLRSRPWGTPGGADSGAKPSADPPCSLLTFSDFNAEAVKNKVLPPPRLRSGGLGPGHL